MRNADQLAVEVHFFPVSADELAERSENLRTLLLRGARRFVQRNRDRNQEAEAPEAAEIELAQK